MDDDRFNLEGISMSAFLQIEVDEQVIEEIRELAVSLHWTSEQVTDELVANGLLMMRRFVFLTKQAKATPDLVERAVAVLRRASKDNPPDPGDELPEDLRYILSEGRG